MLIKLFAPQLIFFSCEHTIFVCLYGGALGLSQFDNDTYAMINAFYFFETPRSIKFSSSTEKNKKPLLCQKCSRNDTCKKSRFCSFNEYSRIILRAMSFFASVLVLHKSLKDLRVFLIYPSTDDIQGGIWISSRTTCVTYSLQMHGLDITHRFERRLRS